jgi:Domain of unknown function (DUF3783)
MTDGGFEKLGCSDRCLYGPRKLLLCGFATEVQPKLKALLAALDLADVPLIWAQSADGEQLVASVLEKPDGSGEGQPSPFPRAIIVAGLEEAELLRLMDGCRRSRMQPPLWATLTPTSEKWPLARLLNELNAERQAFEQQEQ